MPDEKDLLVVSIDIWVDSRLPLGSNSFHARLKPQREEAIGLNKSICHKR
jgi:hypothetical protein